MFIDSESIVLQRCESTDSNSRLASSRRGSLLKSNLKALSSFDCSVASNRFQICNCDAMKSILHFPFIPMTVLSLSQCYRRWCSIELKAHRLIDKRMQLKHCIIVQWNRLCFSRTWKRSSIASQIGEKWTHCAFLCHHNAAKEFWRDSCDCLIGERQSASLV